MQQVNIQEREIKSGTYMAQTRGRLSRCHSLSPRKTSTSSLISGFFLSISQSQSHNEKPYPKTEDVISMYSVMPDADTIVKACNNACYMAVI